MNSSFIIQQIIHIIHPCRFSDEERRRLQAAFRENAPAECLMLQGDPLILGTDHHLMNSHNVAHADSMNADLVLRPFSLSGPAAVGGRLRAHFLHGIEKGECCSAGSVQFPVMMLLHNFDFTVRIQRRRPFDQVCQRGNTQGVICCEKNRNRPGSFINPGLFFFCLSRGGKHHRQPVFFGKIQQVVELKKRYGALVQINARSLIRKQPLLRRGFFDSLFKEGLVDFIATDTHAFAGRGTCMTEGMEALKKKFGEEAERRIRENPGCFLLK